MKTYKLHEHSGLIIGIDIDNNTKSFCDAINAALLDFVTVTAFPGYRIVAVCDDLGESYRYPTCFYADRQGVLFGSLLFFRQYDNSPELSDIEKEDLHVIYANKIHDFNDVRGVLW